MVVIRMPTTQDKKFGNVLYLRETKTKEIESYIFLENKTY